MPPHFYIHYIVGIASALLCGLLHFYVNTHTLPPLLPFSAWQQSDFFSSRYMGSMLFGYCLTQVIFCLNANHINAPKILRKKREAIILTAIAPTLSSILFSCMFPPAGIAWLFFAVMSEGWAKNRRCHWLIPIVGTLIGMPLSYWLLPLMLPNISTLADIHTASTDTIFLGIGLMLPVLLAWYLVLWHLFSKNTTH